MTTTTYGSLSQRTAAYAAVTALKYAEPTLVLQKFGQSKPMPKNKAETIKFRRPVPFGAATTPLTEGVTPSAQAMAYEDVTATLAQYGMPIEITDKVQDLAEDPVLKDAMMLAGDQAGSTIEQVLYGVLKAGTNVFYANGSVRTAVNSVITKPKLRAVVRALDAQKAKKITRVLAPSANYDTAAIEAGYVGVCHTDCKADIRSLDDFVPASKYGSRQPVCAEEFGSVEDVRFVASADLDSWADAGGDKGDMLSTSDSKADVYPILFFGREAFGCVPLKGHEAITPMVLNPNVPRGGDPMGQRGYVSWKTYFAGVILNESWMARLEVGVTAL